MRRSVGILMALVTLGGPALLGAAGARAARASLRGAARGNAAHREPPSRAQVVRFAQRLFRDGASVRKVRELAAYVQPLVDPHGRATPALAEALAAIDAAHGDGFDRKVTRRFQGLLGRTGVKTHRRIELPSERTPYWLTGPQPLARYQSSPTLPEQADVVVIGAGLTGASTAYHLATEARARGLRVVVLDGGDPANQASGRNGGNFELLPENFFGVYEGIEKERYDYLRHVYPKVDERVLRAEATRQAKAVLRLSGKNRERFAEIVATEGIACDYSPKGWLRIAETAAEEQGLRDEARLGRELGLHMEIWSPARIKREKGIDAKFSGRWTADGNYHPFRYVTGVLEAALARGVQLYTRTAVEGVESLAADRHLVKTARGTIEAKTVIAATNAFTSKLFPELGEIAPWQSQIMVTEHAPVTYQGLVTMRQGDLYAHYRDDEQRYADPALAARTRGALTERAPLLQGGGLDRPFKDPSRPRVSRKVHDLMLRDRDDVAPALAGQPPSRAWSGPMAFTRDRLPAIGFLRPGVIVTAGFNGYGGSYTTATGMAAAEMALTGRAPDWVPEEVFSPRRLLTDEPLFDTTPREP